MAKATEPKRPRCAVGGCDNLRERRGDSYRPTCQPCRKRHTPSGVPQSNYEATREDVLAVLAGLATSCDVPPATRAMSANYWLNAQGGEVEEFDAEKVRDLIDSTVDSVELYRGNIGVDEESAQ